MQKIFESYLKIEKVVGGLKFALVLISLFTLSMIVGTLFESSGGVELASVMIYKNPLFMLLQFFLFVSILLATFQRMPLKKRLAGFYVLHSGLILIGCGSLITYLAGVDGSIFLAPNSQTREIILSNYQIKISIPESGLSATKDLPNCIFECEINSTYQGVKFKTFIPFADKKLVWTEIDNKVAIPSSAQYQISNGMMSQKFTMSLNSLDPEFSSQLSLGPLSLFYLPPMLASCFNKNHKSGYIFWNSKSNQCFTPEDRKLSINKTKSNKNFIVIKQKDKILSFFPDTGPWPYDKKFRIDKNSNIRVFSLKMFEKKPMLFLFGKQVSFFDKDQKKWFLETFTHESSIDLPWMGFELTLLHFDAKKTPAYQPVYTFPKKVKNKFVKGGTKAISIEVEGKTYWITEDMSGVFTANGKKIKISIGPELLYLPFQFVLDKFIMKKNPGTQTPASYESFVTVLDEHGPEKSHVYMNNPLKKSGFTFYQASYSQNSDGSYNSTFSANFDPGRPVKYFGSLLLVFGAIWHFGFAQRKRKNKHV